MLSMAIGVTKPAFDWKGELTLENKRIELIEQGTLPMLRVTVNPSDMRGRNQWVFLLTYKHVPSKGWSNSQVCIG
jgi:hypothetical protein